MRKNETLVYDIREITTFKELLDGSAELYGERVAFLYAESEKVTEVTYKEAYEQVKEFASYLRSIFPEGARIAVSGKNSYFWALTYLAVSCGVGTIIPIDKDLRTDEIEVLLETAGASGLVYSSELDEKISGIKERFICLDMAKMSEYLEKGKELIASGARDYEEHKINPHDMGIMLFTSGTTGVSKGVMLSQYNVCSNVMGVARRLKVYPEDRAFSVAPLHHTFECTAGFLSVVYSGGSIAYSSSLRKLQAELKLFRPTIMASVPLILNTFRNAIIKKYNKMKGGNVVLSIQRALSDISGEKAKKKIFSIVNDTFGGRMRLIVCGAAPLEPETFKDYERFGIKVYIGYGLTETSPVVTVHNDFYRSPYDIGYPISGTSVRLDNVNEEGIGELLVKGPGVMLGYYNNKEETDKVMENGWFHTGDLAKKTERGTYCITGRIKSMIVTQGGKKVFPEELELYLDRSPYVCESMVYESHIEGETKITAAIYPNTEEITAKLGIPESDPEYEVKERELLQALISGINKKFPNYKHLGRLVIRRIEFEKTTTRKIKRTSLQNLNEQ